MKTLLTSILWTVCSLDKICMTLGSGSGFVGAWDLLLISLLAALSLYAGMFTHSLGQGCPRGLGNVVTDPLVH